MKSKILSCSRLAAFLAVAAGLACLVVHRAKTPPPPADAAAVAAFDPSAAAAPSSASAVRGQFQVHRAPEAVPPWAVGFGKEFWRRPAAANPAHAPGNNAGAAPPAIHFGDVIERVSHALAVPPRGRFPQVRARDYTARFDGTGVRFSPHLPAANAARETDSDPAVRAQFLEMARADLLAAEPDEQTSTRWEQLLAMERELEAPPAPAPSPTRAARPEVDPATEAMFRTVAVRREGETLYSAEAAPPRPPWSFLGNTAQAQLAAGLIEHYEARAQGVEVTWVLGQPPPGAGPLTVDAALDGLTYAGRTAEGHHYADANGMARLRIGDAVAVDAAGRRWDLAVQAEGGALRVTVPEAVLAQAAYPLAIDPIITAEFGVNGSVTVPSAARQTAPAVASNGAGFLVVWEDDRNAATTGLTIYGARVTSAGAVSDPAGLLLSAAGGSAPAVAANGSGYLVVWEDARNVRTTGLDVYGTRVSSGGVVLDANGLPISVAAGDQFAPALAASPTHFFAVWQDTRGAAATGFDIYGTFVNSAGALSPPGGLAVNRSSETQAAPAAAFNGTNYLIVWTDDRNAATTGLDVYGTLVSPASAVSSPSGLPVNAAAGDAFSPAVAGRAGEFLVAWSDARDAETTGTDIYATRVTGAGTVVTPGGAALSAQAGDELAPAVAATSADYLVVWQDGRNFDTTGPDIYGTRVSAAGAVLNPAGLAVSRGEGGQFTPAVALSGGTYLVVWADERTAERSGPDIFGARLGSTGSLFETNGLPISMGAAAQLSPAVAWNGTNFLVAWCDERNAESSGFDVYGARLNGAGSVLDPGGLAVSRATGDQVNPAAAALGGNFLVVWEDYRPARTNGVDIFGARVSAAGLLLDTNALAISVATGDQLGPVLAVGPAEYLVAWQDWRNAATAGADIYGARVRTSGSVADASGIPISALPSGQYSPALAFNGADYLVVWTDDRNAATSDWDIYGVRVSTAGVVAGPGGFPISRAPGLQYTPAVAAFGSNYFVAWADERAADETGADIYGARATSTGVLAPTNGIPICTAAEYQGAPTVAASATDCVVVWEDLRHAFTTGRDLYGARLDAAGHLVDGADFATDYGPTAPLAPVLVWAGSNKFLVVSQSTGAGADRVVGQFLTLTAPRPILTQILMNAGTVRLTWSAVAGQTYRVQFKSDLGAASWTDLPGDVTAAGDTASKIDTSLGGAPRRFYRVALLP